MKTSIFWKFLILLGSCYLAMVTRQWTPNWEKVTYFVQRISQEPKFIHSQKKIYGYTDGYTFLFWTSKILIKLCFQLEKNFFFNNDVIICDVSTYLSINNHTKSNYSDFWGSEQNNTIRTICESFNKLGQIFTQISFAE